MNIPTKVELTKSESAALKKLADKKSGIDVFIQTVVQQGEARLAELQTEGRQIWEALAKQHNLNLESVNYTLDDAGENLIPTGMKL